MDEIGADRIETVEVEALQQGELLQENRALAPRAAFDDGVAAVVIGQRRLDRRVPAGYVVGGQEAAMMPAGGVEHLLCAAEPVDRLGDKAAIPGVASPLDDA